MKQKLWLGILALVIVLVLAIVSGLRHRVLSGGDAIWVYANKEFAGFPGSLFHPAPVPVAIQLDAICTELKAAKDPATTRAILTRLRALLDSLPLDVASKAVQNYLATNQDAPTQLNLTVKAGGMLGDASSLRVFLLDYLGHLDPKAAGEVATQILANYTTPDEWAVSLRNYAWANPGPANQSFLQMKAGQLLANADWAKNPSVGYLEAFDAIVYAHDTSLTPQLSNLLRDSTNRADEHAAFMTMDRLAINDPVPMLQQLVQNPGLMTGREQARADFVARADVSQPDQRALVEEYLLDSSRSPQELAAFAGIYPNANYMISNNLLTGTATPNKGTIAQHDAAALATVEQWQRDPRFTNLQPYLAQMQQRLATFVGEESANNHP